MDVAADRLQIILAVFLRIRNVKVAGKLSVTVVMPRREGQNVLHQSHQIFRLTGEYDGSLFIESIVQRTDTDGVPSGNKFLIFSVVDDTGIFRIQHGKHIRAVLFIQWQQHLAVTVTFEGIRPLQPPAQLLKAVDLSVANYETTVQLERLHSLRCQTHDCQSVESQNALAHIHETGIIRATGQCTVKTFRKFSWVKVLAAISDNRTHTHLS